MKRKWLSIVCSIMIICFAPLAFQMTSLAAPAEVGVTTLADATFFNSEWAQKNLTIFCQEKEWSKPFAELMGEEMRIYTEDGVITCKFARAQWADIFLEQINAELRSPGFVNPAVPEGFCYQLADGFEAWYLDVVQSRLLTGTVNDVVIELNENTCKVITQAQAETEYAEKSSYVLAGTCTTSFQGSSAARINNIRIAAQNMNGFILESGSVASLDAIFLRRTADNGYKPAGVYSGGMLAVGIGGGICQVSSTAYNALMNAGITVTMRYPHSSPIAYLPLGTDAAISAGSKDLQFRNDYLHPVKLETMVSDKNVTVNVYVKADDMNGRTYKLWGKKLSSMSAKTYLTVYVNGVEAEVREIETCKYRPLKQA